MDSFRALVETNFDPNVHISYIRSEFNSTTTRKLLISDQINVLLTTANYHQSFHA